jgi:hypothetical protein
MREQMQSFDLGRELAEITLGIDAFEAKKPDGSSLLDGEGLVPLYAGGDSVDIRFYDDWDGVRSDLAGLETAISALPIGPRRVFLEGMLKSLKMAVRLFCGGTPSFEEKVTDLVGAPPGREDPALIEDARARLDQLLRRSGFARGSLAERVAAWEGARAVAPDRIENVFRELMAEAKARTNARIFDTGDYDMVLNPSPGMMYTARCDFHEGKMDLNTDVRFTRAALKHLVCHEVYPGHSTQLLYTRAEVDAGRAPADALLVATNAITGCVQEGIGDQGIYLIDWIEDEDDEIYQELRRIRSACQTSAAWMLMVEGIQADKVADYLRDTALGQEAWISGRLRMAAHPFRGPFISSYWAGNESVRRVRERVTPEQWPDFLVQLFGRAQSPQSLQMFPAAQD